MSVRKKVYSSLAVLAVLTAGLVTYKVRPGLFSSVAQAKSAAAKPDDKQKGKEATPVELTTATRSPISAWVSSTANVRALRDVAVATQIEGIVSNVQVEEGDFVKEGQTLATIDDTQFRIKLRLAEEKTEQARIQIEKARIRAEKTVAQTGHTKIELERYQQMQRERLVSEKEAAAYKYKLDELIHDEKVASSEIAELQHRVGELEAEIAQCRLDISRAQIKAPYAGYVTQRQVNLGQRVKAMDALFSIGAFSPLYADAFLSERDTQAVKPGQTATIRLGSDDKVAVQGTVERISPIVDQATGTVKVTLTFQPATGFRPGAFVRVAIRTDTRNDAVLIPRRAVIEEDGQNYVYVANSDTARRKKVELGYQSEGMVEIRNGVAPGEKVVVAGQGALKEGARIRVISG